MNNIMPTPYEVTITWITADIRASRPNWTPEQCSRALERIEKDFEELCIMDGWERLESLLEALEDNAI